MTTSASTRQAAFAKLSAREKHLLQLCAVNGPVSRAGKLAELSELLPGPVLGPREAETLWNAWRAVGLLQHHTVPYDLGELLIRELIDDGKYLQTVDRISGAGRSAGMRYYALSRADWERVLRSALVAGDLPLLRRLQLEFQDSYMADPPNAAAWVSAPLHTTLIRRLPAAMAGWLLDAASRDQYDRAEPEPGLLPLINELAARHPTDPHLRRCIARQRLLAGDLTAWIPGDKNLKAADDLMIDAWAYLLSGDLKRSSARYAKALAALKREAGYVELSGPERRFALLAYALNGTKTRINQARKLAEACFSERLKSFRVANNRALALVEGKRCEVSDWGDHPGDVLVNALVAYWSQQDVDEASVRVAQLAAQQLGWDGLADNLAAASAGDTAPPMLVGLKTVEARWERRLAALEKLAPGASLKATAPQHRVAWRVYFTDDMLIDLTPVQQSNRANVWSSGRPIAMSRLRGDSSKIKGLTDQDLQIIGCLKTRRSSGWGGYSDYDYEWPVYATWKALVGHPGLYRHDDSTATEVVSRPPRLSVTTRGQGKRREVELTMDPPAPESGLVIEDLGDGRIQVVLFDDTQRKLALELRTGLRVPVAANERLGAFVSRLAGLFEVEDQAHSTHAEDVSADPRPVVRLVPRGAEIQATVLVRPLGPEGPALSPGQGAAVVVARVGDRLVRGRRSMDDERQAVVALYRAAPTLGLLEVGEAMGDDALEALHELMAAGAQLEWPEGEVLRMVQAKSGGFSATVKDVRDWFAVSGTLRIDESLVLKLHDVIDKLKKSPTRFIRLDDGRILALTDRLRSQLDTLARVSRKTKAGLEIHPLAAPMLEELLADAGTRRVSKRFTAQLAQTVESAELPRSLKTTLRSYQIDGFRWAARLTDLGIGGCLADDMGLGKTIQALAVLLHRTPAGPALVVAPTSVCGGWIDEVWRHAPTLNVRRYGVGDRAATLSGLTDGDVVVCSYGLLTADAEALAGVRWATLVIDEAQAIKNPQTRRHKAVAALQADARLALTGTPIENHIGELWALFNVLNPGMLGGRDQFRLRFSNPIEGGDRRAASTLRQLILPFVLRRTKTNVLHELPARSDVTVRIPMAEAEATLYETLRRRAVQELNSGEPNPMEVLTRITRLRMAACNPRLVVGEASPGSAKMETFRSIVRTLGEGGHRALVFSQFVRHLTLIREQLESDGVSYLYLDGSTPARERDRLVRAFQDGEGDVFLISLKAGGTGLNLTGADYVIHMDPWWNPAVEDQASDRAHRIGQTRPVTVYRLIVEGTIEDQIVGLHRDKRDLADRLLDGTDAAARMTADDLLTLLRSPAA